MNPNEEHLNEISGDNLEKLSVKPLLYLASIISLVVFLVTFIPYTFYGIHLMSLFSFYFSYTFSYLLLFFIVWIGLIFYYRHQAVHMEELSQYVRIFGVNPRWLFVRTGNRSIDWAGLIIGILLSVLSVIIPGALIFLPGFIFLTLSFYFAIALGSTNKWKLLRRS
jgi:tetrahydromethanopterin S-methyltransferase subunit F